MGTDHPRVSGEHDEDRGFVRNVTGSSPRERGAHLVGDRVRLVVGIIPA